MKIGQYCQRQRCRHVELEQFWQAFASRGFVSDSWAFLFYTAKTGTMGIVGPVLVCGKLQRMVRQLTVTQTINNKIMSFSVMLFDLM